MNLNKICMQKLCLFILTLLVSATLFSQNVGITFKGENLPLKSILNELEKKSDFTFIYSPSTIDVNQKISITANSEDFFSLLDRLCRIAKISYKTSGRQIVLTPLATSEKAVNQQNVTENGKKITGTVLDENREPVAGAYVILQNNKKIGTYTDAKGKFEINIPNEYANDAVLLFSFFGLKATEVKIGDDNNISVVMPFEEKQLDDVVVTGYQTISRERATGSFAIVTQNVLNTKMQTNIINKIEGMVAGLNIYRGSVQIRGVSTINGNKNPLYVVDGVPFEGEPGSNASPLDVINPADVVNVTVLKDATAASIYGARSANGVIVITTRNGEEGATRVNYNGSVSMIGLPDRGYANKMNSSELVDYQLMLMETYPKLSRKGIREYQNPVQSLMLDKKEGKITQEQLEQALIPYRNFDRYDQVKNEFLRKYSIKHQHNLALTGGTKIHKYNFSVNYSGTAPYEKAQYEDRLGFNLKNTFDFFKWLSVDAGILYSQVKSDYDNGILGMSYLDAGGASYLRFREDNGEPSQWYQTKSQYEIDRLKALGLQDETFYPVNELKNRRYTAKTNYLNINLNARIKILDGLTASIRYQTEQSNGFTKQYDTKDAISVKTMINDAVQMVNGVPKYNIPVGGQIVQKWMDNYSYTFRAQIDYNKQLNDNNIVQFLAGAEARKVVTSGNGFYRLGYDDNNLGYSEIDALTLSKMLSGTESIYGTFSFSNKTPASTFVDNRYLSFYANGSYTLNNKATFTGSIRIDQSNLFGTDPKYQYRPLWSLGAHYELLRNYNWIDRLAVRVTYGINGNIPKLNGPYLIAKVDRNNYYTNENAMYIASPPNPQLRWEKTKVFNVGVDFNLLKNRLDGSIEFYDKHTNDLLGPFAIDPTLGWTDVDINFGSMYNRGVEIALNSQNIKKENFSWSSSLLFSYNKNMITRVEETDESAYSYYYGTNIRKGYPMGALFSVRYKGLNQNGAPVGLTKDGQEILNYNQLTKDDLVYSGVVTPPYNASLTNTISWKGFELSFMFIYSGGHVMRDVAASYTITSHPMYAVSNVDKNMANYWKKAGDENKPNVNPAFMFQSTVRNGEYIYKAADKFVKKADFIKLRDLILSYNLPSKITKKMGIGAATINFQARNLWWWAANGDLDPEVWTGTSLSPTRGTKYPAEFIVGLNINL